MLLKIEQKYRISVKKVVLEEKERGSFWQGRK